MKGIFMAFQAVNYEAISAPKKLKITIKFYGLVSLHFI